MNAAEKIARQRLSVLQLAEALGNITAACRQRGMHRSQFYEYKRRFQTHGLEGLKDLPPIPKSHPMTTPPEVVERIVQLSLEHPAWGCVRLSNYLKLQGISVSSPTIQSILTKHGMGTRYDRWLKLEEKNAQKAMELTGEQVAFIEKTNPAFKERHVESSRPGELLCQDTFFSGTLKGVGRVYLHTVVDTYSSFAFGFLHTSKVPEAAVAVLHNDVIPFYQQKNIPLTAVLTDNGREFCGRSTHPYELYLELHDIQHRRTKVRQPQTNGFVERFHRTVLDEFLREAFRTKLYESVEALQEDFDNWLRYYNLESYEDALNNLTFDAESGKQALSLFKDEYLLHYMLKWETRHSDTLLHVEKLQAPFSYKLRLHRDGETRERPVDLPETFNYLLGLDVRTRHVCNDNGRRYLVYRGALRNGRKVAVIWRETKDWTAEDYERDRTFVTEQKLADGAEEIFVNGDSVIPSAQSLDPLFKERMFTGVGG